MMTEKYYQINEEGHSIKAKQYFTEPRRVRRVVVSLHGFGGHKDNRAAARFAEHLLKKHKDFAVLAYDAPAHGDDVKKSVRLSDCMTYLRLVTDDAGRRFHTDSLYAYGTSFGGYQLLKYVSDNGNSFEKIALRCPAVSMYDTFAQGIMSGEEQRTLERGKSVKIGFDRKVSVTKDFLTELKAADISQRDFSEISERILIIHGTKDEIVPFAVSERFADRNDILFISAEGADHRFKDPVKMDLAIKNVIDFYEL